MNTQAPTPAQPESAAQQFLDGLEGDLLTAWHDVESFGEFVLEEGQTLANDEIAAVKTAVTGIFSKFTPAMLTMLKSWGAQVKAELGAGAALSTIWSGVLTLAKSQGVTFLQTVEASAGQAILGALIGAL